MSRAILLCALIGLSICSADAAVRSDAGPTSRPARKGDRTERSRPGDQKWPADFKVTDHIVYKTVGDTKLELAIFAPAEKKFEKTPLVVYIHGGGWGSGDRFRVVKPGLVEVVRALSKEGITVASIEYRLTVKGGSSAYDAAADCKDAVRFLAKNADKYGFDRTRIGTFGSSAGGHLTLVTALGDDKDYPCDPSLNDSGAVIRCVAAHYPLVSLLNHEVMETGNFSKPERLVPLLGGTLEEKMDIAHKLSPLELVRKDSPAIFVAHGDADTTLSYKNATILRDVATAKGARVECVISHGAGHGFNGQSISPTIPEIAQKTADFFLRELTK